MKDKEEDKSFEDIWYWYLTGEHRSDVSRRAESQLSLQKFIFGLLPGRPRCNLCNVPMAGLSNLVLKPFWDSRPASYNPKICNDCERDARKEEGGAEVELTMLFADVRGSTSLAEQLPTSEFKALIQRFYRVTTDVLVKHNAMVNRLMGDQVIGLFVPRFAGHEHARVAVAAAMELLSGTGHLEPDGPWVPVGIGVHTGRAYVGAVGTGEGVNEIAVLGSAANLAARLSSQAADGDLVISEETAAVANIPTADDERRSLNLKGFNEPVQVRVIHVHPPSSAH